MSIYIILMLIASYFFVGAFVITLIDYSIVGIVIWPIVLCIIAGEEVGYFILRKLKK